MNLNWQVKHFGDLTLNEFHDIIAIRIEAFVIEQNCTYQDLDGKDKKCYHVICRDGKGAIVSTARIAPPGLIYDEIAIGRIVLTEALRGKGIGHELMKECIDFCKLEFGNTSIRISAQTHLEKYYGHHNFIPTGKQYLEDGIPHSEMLYTPK
ncbi:MAG: ElaA protein [Flavobacteriaceae bacterium]|jgi:ElaA protein